MCGIRANSRSLLTDKTHAVMAGCLTRQEFLSYKEDKQSELTALKNQVSLLMGKFVSSSMFPRACSLNEEDDDTAPRAGYRCVGRLWSGLSF